MKYGTGIRKGTVERLKRALNEDNTIVTPKNKLEETKGNTEDYLCSIGLTPGDLLRLERAGFALRGYTVNYWGPGQTLSNGRVVPEDKLVRGNGSRVRWIILGDDDTNERTQEQEQGVAGGVSDSGPTAG